MNEELALLYRFFSAIEANLFAGLLRSEGMEAFIRDENINTIYPFSNLATGGIKIYVRHSDEEQARELLGRFLQSHSLYEEDELSYAMPCPSCGSANTLVVPVEKKSYYDEFRCFDCDYLWDNRTDKNINPGVWE